MTMITLSTTLNQAGFNLDMTTTLQISNRLEGDIIFSLAAITNIYTQQNLWNGMDNTSERENQQQPNEHVLVNNFCFLPFLL